MEGSATSVTAIADTRSFSNPAGFYRFPVGDFDCIALSEGDCGPGSPLGLAADQQPRDVEQLLRSRGIDPSGGRINATALAVQHAGETVLIDSGFGIFSTPDGENRPGRVAPNLSAAGVEPEEVDLVIISHAHGDHLGGLLTAEGELTYPRARYVLPRAEWQFWMDSDPDLSAMLIPEGFQAAIKGQASTVLPRIRERLELAEPGDEPAPGMRLVATPGHTHGMVGVEVGDGDERLLYLSDVFMHQVLSVTHPEWRVGMDLDPSLSTDTRRVLLKRLAASGELAFSFHFPWAPLGRIVERDGQHEWVPVEWRWWS